VLEHLPKGKHAKMPLKYEDTVYSEIVGIKKTVTNEPADEKASSHGANEDQKEAGED